MARRLGWVVFAAALSLPFAAGCGRERPNDADLAPTTQDLAGRIRIDGSSTLQPFAAAAAERFRRAEPGVRVSVGASGTGGGLEKFCAGEIDVANASRAIEDDERAACAKEGIEFLELHVANDGIAVIASRENDWAACLTTDRLAAIWRPGSKVKSWRDVDPSYPDEALRLAGPGTNSGTFDFFTGEIVGEEGASRSDYSASENDNVIVEAVAGRPGGLGYLGLSYALENTRRVATLELDGGDGCVEPTEATVQDETYPLSRPLLMYVREDALREVQVDAFLTFVIDEQRPIAERARFVPLTADQVARAQTALEEAGSDVVNE